MNYIPLVPAKEKDVEMYSWIPGQTWSSRPKKVMLWMEKVLRKAIKAVKLFTETVPDTFATAGVCLFVLKHCRSARSKVDSF